MEAAASSTEIVVIGWSVILLIAHIAVQTVFLVKDTGRGYVLGTRDDERPVGAVAGRLTRALANFVETYVAFVGLALALAVTGKTGGLGAAGAWIWFLARVVYVPIYAAGVPVVRTVLWTISAIGLVLMLIRLMA